MLGSCVKLEACPCSLAVHSADVFGRPGRRGIRVCRGKRGGSVFFAVKMPGALPFTLSTFGLMTVAVVAPTLPAARVDIMGALRSE